jgi:hypothetical protein
LISVGSKRIEKHVTGATKRAIPITPIYKPVILAARCAATGTFEDANVATMERRDGHD